MVSEPATDEGKRVKRPRIKFTPDQMKQLLSLFDENKYPDLFMQRDIAEGLGLTQTNVYVSLFYFVRDFLTVSLLYFVHQYRPTLTPCPVLA